MTRQELVQIHVRFFNSPKPIPQDERERYNKNMQGKKAHQKPGIVIWNKGTFVGNIRATFKLGR
jgi:hypothetical protein